MRTRFADAAQHADAFVVIRTTVADLENFGGGDNKIYEHKLWIISKFWMFMINVLDLAQTCWGYF